MDFLQKALNWWRFRPYIQLIIIIAAIFIVFFTVHYTNFVFDYQNSEEIEFLVFCATTAIAVIAWYEFNKSNELAANEFLLFASKIWNGAAIIKARGILHEIFTDAYRCCCGNNSCEYNEALQMVSEKVLQMSKKKGLEGGNFVYLLNLLDYLETLSYFHNRGELKLEDVENTCGNNAIFFYKCFKAYIERRQLYSKKAFKNFSTLYDKLDKSIQ